jgi:hypothetical protein
LLGPLALLLVVVLVAPVPEAKRENPILLHDCGRADLVNGDSLETAENVQTQQVGPEFSGLPYRRAQYVRWMKKYD